jgi:putative addiction module antidote
VLKGATDPMTTLQLTSVGNSIGLVIPQDILTRLKVAKGDLLSVIETLRGIELTPYDAQQASQICAAEKVMREDSVVLNKLAQ